MENIRQALIKLFDRHRIVFWYDEKNELRRDFETLDFPGVEKSLRGQAMESLLHHAGRPDQHTCQQTGPEELKFDY